MSYRLPKLADATARYAGEMESFGRVSRQDGRACSLLRIGQPPATAARGWLAPGDHCSIFIDPSILGRAINNPDTSAKLLPASAFAFIGPYDERGNLGTNTFRRDGIRNLNAALTRTWNVAHEKSLTLRAESINLLNTPQFAEPGVNLTSPSFGKITNTVNDGRTFQFQLRFGF